MGNEARQTLRKLTLSAAQLEALRDVPATETIGWEKPRGLDQAWEEAILSVNGVPPADSAPGQASDDLDEDLDFPFPLGSAAKEGVKANIQSVDSVDMGDSLPVFGPEDLPDDVFGDSAPKSVFSRPKPGPERKPSAPPPPPSAPSPPQPDLKPLPSGDPGDPAGQSEESFATLSEVGSRFAKTDSEEFPKNIGETLALSKAELPGPASASKETLALDSPEDMPTKAFVRPSAQAPKPETRLFKIRLPPTISEDALSSSLRGVAAEGDSDGGPGVVTPRAPSFAPDGTPINLAGVDGPPLGAEDNSAKRTLAFKDAIRSSGGGGAALARTTADFQTLSLEADFVLHSKIGSGGQGEVWRAWQSTLHREIAIKRMTSGKVDDFLQEAYTSAQLDHPNIVPVHDLGRVNVAGKESPLLAMKLVRGTPWIDQIKAARKELDFNLEIFLANHIPVLIDVCNAVAYAHAKRIVHRDLKPSQVMVGEFGEVFLMDWGLAVSTSKDVELVARDGIPKHRTLATAINRCGSPAYMAPEQTWDETDGLGFHTDIYLLGAILYQLATGRPPHAAPSAMEAFERAAQNVCEEPPLDCPPYLRDLMERCLASEPAERPASVRELREALQSYLNGADRQRESKHMVVEVNAVIEAFGRENLGYEQLTLLQQRLGRALQLWPENPEAKGLHKRLLALHAERALEARDLELGRTLAISLPESEGKEKLLREIMAAEAERDLEFKRAREANAQRKRARMIIAGLVVVAVAQALALVSRAVSKANWVTENAAEVAEADQARRKLEAQAQVYELRLAERSLAEDLARLAPPPSALERPSASAGPESVSPEEARKLLQRRAELAASREELGHLALMEGEPFDLLIGEANLRLALSGAESQTQKAYEVYRKASLLRPDRPEPLEGMGVAASRLGKAEEAFELLEKAAAKARSFQGAGSFEAAKTLALAASARAALDPEGENSPRVAALKRESIAAMEPRWLELSRSLAEQWRAVGDPETAGEFERFAAAAYRRDSGQSPLEAAKAYRQQALHLAKTGRRAEAVRPLLEALDIRRRELGEEHPETLACYRELGLNLAAQGWRAEAIPLLRRALAGSARALSWDHPDALESARGLFALLAWPRGGDIPSGDEPKTVLALGQWLERAFESQTALSREELRRRKTGWLYVEAAMAQAAVSLNPPRGDIARRLLARSEALARAAGLPAQDALRTDFLQPLAKRLDGESALSAVPAPPEEFSALAPEQKMDASALRAYLDQAAASPELPVAWNELARESGDLNGEIEAALEAIRRSASAGSPDSR